MQAIIPAAGLGSRLLPFSAAASKELAPIGTLPAIQWVLLEAAALGVRRAAVVISPHKDTLRAFLRGEFPEEYRSYPAVAAWRDLLARVEIAIVEQPRAVGLGDALLRGHAVLAAGPVYLMYPDNIVTDWALLFDRLRQAAEAGGCSCVAGKVDKPYFRGNHFVVGGRPAGYAFQIEGFTRRDDPRPQGNIWRAAGRSFVTEEFFARLRSAQPGIENRELDDIDAYDPMAKEGRLLGLPPVTPIFDAGSPRGYAEAWTAFLEGSLKPADF